MKRHRADSARPAMAPGQNASGQPTGEAQLVLADFGEAP